MLWREILDLAVRAPSPHNVQPWKVVIHDEHRASVFLDSSRTLPVVDDTGSFVLMSMSMFTESIRLLAANRRHRVETDMLFSGFHSSTLVPYANLRLISDPAVVSLYDDSVFLKRRTSRVDYLRKPVPAGLIENSLSLFEGTGHRSGFTTERGTIETLIASNIEALFCDLNEEGYYRELCEYLRFSDEESAQRRDGLDYRCMNMRGYELKGLTKFPFLLKTPLIKSVLFNYYRQKLGHTEMMAWISGPYWEAQHAIAIGAPFMRFWLETARNDLYILPFGNLVTNPTAHKKMSALVGCDAIWIIFKIGYSDPPPESLRLTPGEVILND